MELFTQISTLKETITGNQRKSYEKVKLNSKLGLMLHCKNIFPIQVVADHFSKAQSQLAEKSIYHLPIGDFCLDLGRYFGVTSSGPLTIQRTYSSSIRQRSWLVLLVYTIIFEFLKKNIKILIYFVLIIQNVYIYIYMWQHPFKFNFYKSVQCE